MRVVLFCGGLGTRLREHSDTIPKPLVNVGLRPILWHLMRYYAHFGHKDFILCLGYRGDLIREYFLNYNECMSNDFTLSDGGRTIELHSTDTQDWRITFVDTGLHSNIGQRLLRVRGYLSGEEEFLANYADGLSDLDLLDLAWSLLAGIDDWPHSGGPFVDQNGDPTIVPGNPYGNGALQLAEGMTYIGRYPGTADIYWRDLPFFVDPYGPGGFSFGGLFTGQTYGIYPDGWVGPTGNPVGGFPAMGPDGVSPLIQLDIPIGPPLYQRHAQLQRSVDLARTFHRHVSQRSSGQRVYPDFRVLRRVSRGFYFFSFLDTTGN